jgi:hypothetical protein
MPGMTPNDHGGTDANLQQGTIVVGVTAAKMTVA